MPLQVPQDQAGASSAANNSPQPPVETIPVEETPFKIRCNGCDSLNIEKYCSQCNGPLCMACFCSWPIHLKKDSSHKSISFQEYKAFNDIALPRFTPEERDSQHNSDILTLWFSVDEAPNSQLGLQEYPQYRRLIQEHRHQFSLNHSCYSQIVSFIGSTGAGKSTLMRILMQRPWLTREQTATEPYSTYLPIPGDPNSTIPTSGDVHLYKGPLSDIERPWNVLLYADCEGFRGGSRAAAVAAKDRALNNQTPVNSNTFNASVYSYLRSGVRRLFTLGGDRERAVKELFPRLLYNFSDVVVHVMTESAMKEMESELTRLIQWAQNSLDTAINRAILPRLIVILNKCSSNVKDWDPINTTAEILDQQVSAVNSNKVLRSYLKMFRRVEEDTVETLGYLLSRCYSSIRIIRLPTADNQYIFSRQLKILDESIKAAVLESEKQKISSKCWIETGMQSRLFSAAFDHYKESLDKPFDFLESLYSVTPIEANLVTSFFELLKRARKAGAANGETLTAKQFLKAVTPVLCSIAALDSCRSSTKYPGKLKDRYKGKAIDVHQVGLSDSGTVTYQSQVAKAVAEFIDRSCPCEYKDGGGNMCVNSRLSHYNIPYHQDDSGKVIGDGTFESDFVDTLLSRWNNEIDRCLDDLDNELNGAMSSVISPGQMETGDLMLTWTTHLKTMQRLYDAIPALDITDIGTCCWCFANTPVKSLPCGHVICWNCAQMAGESVAFNAVVGFAFRIDSCDFHREKFAFKSPIYIHRPHDEFVAPQNV